MNRIALFLNCVVIMILSARSVVCSSQAKPPFSLTIAATTEVLKAGEEELRLLVTIKNTSDATVILARSPGPVPREEGFRCYIEIHDTRGKEPPPSTWVLSLKGKPTITESSNLSGKLEPGDSFVEQVTVTKFFDLSKPGKYTISLIRPLESWQKLGEGKVKSNSISVTVEP
jgi:hypothetical protein